MISCRMCKGSGLTKFLDLGFTPPADQFLRKEQLHDPEVYYPLEVLICNDCGLSQLSYIVSPEILYRHDYPYEASITKTGHSHWAEFAKTVVKRFKLSKKDLVIDIGSNVGVLLEEFKSNGTRILGIDPASNIVRIAEKRGIETLNEFFNLDVAKQVLSKYGKASVITATNVFAHIDDLDDLMKSVNLLLDKEGIFIVEAPYFLNLIKNLEYDTIYHEHLSYLAVKPMLKFFSRFGMEIIEIEERDIHGGSFRVYVSRKGKRKVSININKFLKIEKSRGIFDIDKLNQFAIEVNKNRDDLNKLLRELKNKNKRIAGVSAPAKGMTLLNYCRIGPEILEYVTEKSTLKIGRYTPGTHIPVTSDERLIKDMPDYALLLAWNFADEIINNLKEYRNKGGKFIIPIPKPKII